MNKRVGMEAMTGLGGGTVSEASRKYLEIAEDLCRKDRPREAVPYLNKALDADAYNLDAYVQLAYLAPNFDMSIDVCKTAEYKGRAKLINQFGPDCFKDGSEQVGQFWGILQTRPYMRVLQATTRFYVEKKDYPKAAETIIEMLRLCPGDNLGQRDWLSSLLVMTNRMEDALYFAQVWIAPDRPGIVPRGGCDFKKPSSSELSSALMEKLSKYCKATFLYDAAYAAFKLWGDCTLAKQYLLLAVRNNPVVLVKILSRATKQATLNPSARSLNSPEEASDYLWLAQDIWIVPDVWDWAAGQKEVFSLLLRNCSREGCGNTEQKPAEFKRCAACHRAWYCGQDCQKRDWNVHKKPCKAQIQMKSAMRAINQGRPPKGDDLPFIAATADFSSQGVISQLHGV